MIINKIGLLLNLLGSLSLALHIVGIKRMESWENRIKNLPKIMSTNLSTFILVNILRFAIKWAFITRKREAIIGLIKIINYIKNGEKLHFSIQWPFKHENPFLYHLVRSILWSAIISIPLWIILFLPFIIPLYIITKAFSCVQDKAKIKTYFGLIGIVLLIIGFALQLFS